MKSCLKQMVAKVEFGHKWSLHTVDEKPEHGFGYPNATHLMTEEEVQARAVEWTDKFAKTYQVTTL